MELKKQSTKLEDHEFQILTYLRLIDWGFSAKLNDESYYLGSYCGTLRTASQNILLQRLRSDCDWNPILSKPSDDLESLVKSFLLIIDRYMGNDLITNLNADVYQFWESHGAFLNIKRSLNGDFSNIEVLREYFSRPVYKIETRASSFLNVLAELLTFPKGIGDRRKVPGSRILGQTRAISKVL